MTKRHPPPDDPQFAKEKTAAEQFAVFLEESKPSAPTDPQVDWPTLPEEELLQMLELEEGIDRDQAFLAMDDDELDDWDEELASDEQFDALFASTKLMRHAFSPPVLRAEAKASIAEELFGAPALVPVTAQELRSTGAGSAKIKSASWFSRLVEWFQPRPGVAWAMGGAFAVAIVVLSGTVYKQLQPSEPSRLASIKNLPLASHYESPWHRAQNPMLSTTGPSERLQKVLEHQYTQRQDRWMYTLASKRILQKKY